MNLEELDRRAGEVLASSEQLLEAASQVTRRKRQPFSLQRSSANRKLAPQRVELAKSGRTRFVATGPYVVSTYASIKATCPDTCRFKAGGCYAKAGASHLTMAGLDRGAQGWPAVEVSLAEARAINSLWPTGVPQDGHNGGRDLRLHVGGEVSCAFGAGALGDAARRWLDRGGGAVWTYTHRWEEIPRRYWGPISVFASVEAPVDVEIAHDSGYAVAITVPEFRDGHRPWELQGGLRAIPCPYEPGSGLTCSTCRLCLDRGLGARGQAIAFAVHGADSDKARRSLTVLQGVA